MSKAKAFCEWRTKTKNNYQKTKKKKSLELLGLWCIAWLAYWMLPIPNGFGSLWVNFNSPLLSKLIIDNDLLIKNLLQKNINTIM